MILCEPRSVHYCYIFSISLCLAASHGSCGNVPLLSDLLATREHKKETIFIANSSTFMIEVGAINTFNPIND